MEMAMTTPPFRILSIDGGGLKGAFAASFLATLERELGNPLIEHFDLISGTSTGGIIALGLSLGIPAQAILDFYRDEGPRIFPAARRGWWSLLGALKRPVYDPDALQKALTAVFGSRTLMDCQRPLLIPAFQVQQGKLTIFKTAHHPDYVRDHRQLAVDIARATSAAPVYLPAAHTADGLSYLDGGIAANNPALLAVIEAMTVFKQLPHDIHVLSLGCPGPLFDLPAHCRTGKLAGLKAWALQILPTVLAAQDAMIDGCVQKLIPPEHYFRRTLSTAHGRYRLDLSDHHAELAALGAQNATDCLARLRPLFFASRADRNHLWLGRAA